MAAFYLGDPRDVYPVRRIFANMGEPIPSYAERVGVDMVDCVGAVSHASAPEQLAVFCGGGAVAGAHGVLVFIAGAKAEIQVSIPL